jgi:uncharacterized protein YndB with AHSA1/START domain
VNLVHRLLKNHVGEATTWKAYALFTEKSLEHLGMQLEDTHKQSENYEHLGQVITHSINMRSRYDEMVSVRRIMLTDSEADLAINIDFPTPPPVTWEWLQDPAKRNLWSGDVHWYNGDRPRGRAGRGASNHCAHGKGLSTEVTLDWRPFEYSTVDSYEGGKIMFTETIRLEPLPDGGTRVHDLSRLHLPLPRWMRRIAARIVLINVYKYEQLLMKAARLAGEEYQSLNN